MALFGNSPTAAQRLPEYRVAALASLDLEQHSGLGSCSVSAEQTERVIHFKFGIPLIVTVQLDRFVSEEHKTNAWSNCGLRNHYIGKLGAQ